MKRWMILACFILSAIFCMAKNIIVKDNAALTQANAAAKPGDTVILQNGNWADVQLTLTCSGTKEKPILFKAETAGKVIVTGHSKLQIGGSFIIVDGLYFTNGYSGNDAVITFRAGKYEVANNCRVTNTVINDFNNPKRLQENYWVALYGINNRVDHCSFINKKNIGVLLAVILEDERSRENFHAIDHNYFGLRLPLASNGGEIIRVGVSEHCQFSSNTQITDNFFEHCDGETEIISIKSCNNAVRNNLFKECQGGVVLRHGNYNTVESNVFLGNNKEGTGGVRIINKGNWVVNNFFYKCRGEGFRSPLSIMNGIPNSPANRYLEVSEAVISNNSFHECTPISLCEGSDAERTVQPYNVQFINNLFFNTRDNQLYNAYDNISGISFAGNLVSNSIAQQLSDGFTKTSFTAKNAGDIIVPDAGITALAPIPDSLQTLAIARLTSPFSPKQGLRDASLLQKNIDNAAGCGARWFSKKSPVIKQLNVNCKNATEVIQCLETTHDKRLTINLTGSEYLFSSPININTDVLITSSKKQTIRFTLPVYNATYFIKLKAGSMLTLKNLNLDLASATINHTFITTDTSGNSNHSNFSMYNCSIINCKNTFFTAAKSSLADSIIINNCSFSNGSGAIFSFTEETDKKGYYNVEQLKITNSFFSNNKGQLLSLLRSGKDESTMGPLLVFSQNKVQNCSIENDAALLHIAGVQRSLVEKNNFTGSNTNKKLIIFEDWVRAVHVYSNNTLINSGKAVTNSYTKSLNNSTR